MASNYVQETSSVNTVKSLPPETLRALSRINGPLAKLHKTSTYAILNYPADLNSENKRHYVKFSIKKIVTSGSAGFASAAIAGGGNDTAFGINVGQRVTEPIAAVALYMPDTLNASYNASYDELSLTHEMGNVLQGAEMIRTAASGILNKNPGNAMSSDAGVSAIKSSVIAAATSLLGTGDATRDINLQAAGYTINPQLQMIYRGVAFRHFQLTFTFTPSNQQETETVKSIIEMFKINFAPILRGEGDSTLGMFFTPPSIFNVDFMIDSGINQYLPKYGDCVLSDIDVNYAPSGFAPHADGSPVQTQLNLTFKEIEILTQGKLQTELSSATNGSVGGLR